MPDHCDVSLGDYDSDPFEFYHETQHTARKPHKCHECFELIPVGVRYHVVTGKWDGGIETYKFCDGCWEIMGEFGENGGRTFGITWDAFSEEWSQGASLQGCLNRLSSAQAKALMTRQWMKWKGLMAR